MMKKLVAVLIAAAILVAGGITIGSVVSNQPEMVVKTALKGAVEGLAERDEFSTILKVMDGGSVTIDGEFDGVNINGKFYLKDFTSQTDAQIYIDDLTVKAEGQKFNASAYVSSDYAYITDCNLLDDTWGIVRGNTQAEFLESIFAFGSGNELALPEETSQQISVALKLFDEETDKAFQKDLDKYLKKYQTKLESIFAEHANFAESFDKVVIGADRMECRIITVTVDEEALANMVSDLYGALSKDKSLRKTFLKYAEIYKELEDGEFDAEKYYDETILNETSWNEFMEEIKAEKFELTVDVVTPKSSPTLRKLAVHVETDTLDEDVFSIDFGKNGIEKSTYITVEYDGHTYAYEVAEDNRSLYEAYIHYDKQEVAHLEVDRKKDTFEFTYNGVTVSGDFIENGDTVTIARPQVAMGGNSVSYDISITLDEKDAMPELEKKDAVTSVFEITDEDIAELKETIEKLFG